MRYLLLLISVACGTHFATAQTPTDHRPVIREKLETYYQANKDKDYDKVLDMVYPKLFTLVPRETMKQVFLSMENEGMQFGITEMSTGSISEVFSQENLRYAQVEYAMVMVFKFTKPEQQTPEFNDLMLSSFRTNYGEDRVALKDGQFRISLDKTMYAIASPDKDDWTFIELNEGQDAMVEALIPEAVRAHFAQ